MKKIVRFSVNRPWRVIGAVLCITVFFLFQIPRVKIDPRVEIVLKQNNPVEEVYNRNRQEFESYADVLIGMLHDDVYNPGSLEKIRRITEEVENIPGVKKVTSILNVKNIAGGEEGLRLPYGRRRRAAQIRRRTEGAAGKGAVLERVRGCLHH